MNRKALVFVSFLLSTVPVVNPLANPTPEFHYDPNAGYEGVYVTGRLPTTCDVEEAALIADANSDGLPDVSGVVDTVRAVGFAWYVNENGGRFNDDDLRPEYQGQQHISLTFPWLADYVREHNGLFSNDKHVDSVGVRCALYYQVHEQGIGWREEVYQKVGTATIRDVWASTAEVTFEGGQKFIEKGVSRARATASLVDDVREAGFVLSHEDHSKIAGPAKTVATCEGHYYNPSSGAYLPIPQDTPGYRRWYVDTLKNEPKFSVGFAAVLYNEPVTPQQAKQYNRTDELRIRQVRAGLNTVKCVTSDGATTVAIESYFFGVPENFTDSSLVPTLPIKTNQYDAQVFTLLDKDSVELAPEQQEEVEATGFYRERRGDYFEGNSGHYEASAVSFHRLKCGREKLGRNDSVFRWTIEAGEGATTTNFLVGHSPRKALRGQLEASLKQISASSGPVQIDTPLNKLWLQSLDGVDIPVSVTCGVAAPNGYGEYQYFAPDSPEVLEMNL